MNQPEFTNPEFKGCKCDYHTRWRIDYLRRALAICNRLKPSPTKARHVSRIFRALNKLRAAV